VTLRGGGVLTGVVDRNTYPITLNINLDNGSVSGSSSFSGTAKVTAITGIDEETGQETYQIVYCPFNATISFKGTLDLATHDLSITANVVSKYSASGYCAQLGNKYLQTVLTGKLNHSATYASGTDSERDAWHASR